MQDVYKVLIFSVVAYLYLLIIAKLLGKKQIAQLSFIDYIIGISIGSTAAQMSVETEQPIYHYLIAMTVFFLLALIIAYVSHKSASLKRFLNGKPAILINEGKIQYENMKKTRMTVDELTGMARAKNYFDLNDVAFAILETSGDLSILPKSHAKPPTVKDLGIMTEKPKLTEYIVVDGSVSTDGLENLSKDKEWLFKGLKIQNEKELENILIASYDENTQNFNVQYKYHDEKMDN